MYRQTEQSGGEGCGGGEEEEDDDDEVEEKEEEGDEEEEGEEEGQSVSWSPQRLLNSCPRSWIHLLDTHLLPTRTGQAACRVR